MTLHSLLQPPVTMSQTELWIQKFAPGESSPFSSRELHSGKCPKYLKKGGNWEENINQQTLT